MLPKVKAFLDFSLDVQCPECNKHFDLVKQDDDGELTMLLFNNKWEDVLYLGESYFCPHCEKEVELASIEY